MNEKKLKCKSRKNRISLFLVLKIAQFLFFQFLSVACIFMAIKKKKNCFFNEKKIIRIFKNENKETQCKAAIMYEWTVRLLVRGPKK